MAVRNDPNQLAPLYVLAVVLVGGLAYWWLQLPETARLEILATVARAEGTSVAGRIPRDSIPMQLWWMVRHRGGQLEGMVRLVALCLVVGGLEGRRKRESVKLAGFGLGLFTLGRVLLAASMLGLMGYLVVPVVMPYVWVACVLSSGFGGSCYLLARGLPRVS